MLGGWGRWFSPADGDAASAWPQLRLLLLAGFALRVVIGLVTDTWAHADECFQYLEQGHRLTFGYGWRPWEYDYGIRSWIIPCFISLLLWPFKLTGLDSPYLYQPAIEIVFSAISLVLPYAMYRIGRALVSERAGRFALVFGCFWYELAALGHRPLADALAMYALFGALALVLQPPRREVVIAVGALAALTLLLRFQLLPVTGLVLGLAVLRWRMQAVMLAPGFAALMLLGGALDYYTWGVWFSSIVTNFEMNATRNVSSGFGQEPAYWYPLVVVIASGGLCLAGVAGLALSWRQSWPLIAIAVVQVGFFTLVAHKELRFILPVTPVWLIGAAILAARAPAFIWIKARVRPFLVPAFALAMTSVSGLALAEALPRQYLLAVPPPVALHDARQAYRYLSTQPDVKAVLDLVNPSPWESGGYYDLHVRAPIYLPARSSGGKLFTRGGDTARADPLRYASHILRPVGDLPAAGFVEIARIGAVAIDRQASDMGALPLADDFDYRIRPDVPLPPPPPGVTPRW